jgi:hypothetical protein
LADELLTPVPPLFCRTSNEAVFDAAASRRRSRDTDGKLAIIPLRFRRDSGRIPEASAVVVADHEFGGEAGVEPNHDVAGLRRGARHSGDRVWRRSHDDGRRNTLGVGERHHPRGGTHHGRRGQ